MEERAALMPALREVSRRGALLPEDDSVGQELISVHIRFIVNVGTLLQHA